MRPKIYLFGDSITEESFGDGGWGASLAHQFSRTLDVVLRGYSGYNTRWAQKHVPVDEYKQNLRSIVSFLKKQWPATHIILITPPPIDEDGRLQFPYIENPSNQPERTNEAAGAFAEACVAVARESGLPVIDLWTKMQQFPDWQKAHLRDGLHLTLRGNRLVFEEVVAKLRDEGLSLESLPVDLPLIADIDPKDPLKAFQK
ncbi:GDSL esterase/lipase [Rosa sericea]